MSQQTFVERLVERSNFRAKCVRGPCFRHFVTCEITRDSTAYHPAASTRKQLEAISSSIYLQI